MLVAIRRALKSDGRLVILESVMPAQAGASRESQESQHHLAPQFLQRDVIEAGFLITRFEDNFTRRGGNHPEYMLVVTPIPPPGSGSGQRNLTVSSAVDSYWRSWVHYD